MQITSSDGSSIGPPRSLCWSTNGRERDGDHHRRHHDEHSRDDKFLAVGTLGTIMRLNYPHSLTSARKRTRKLRNLQLILLVYSLIPICKHTGNAVCLVRPGRTSNSSSSASPMQVCTRTYKSTHEHLCVQRHTNTHIAQTSVLLQAHHGHVTAVAAHPTLPVYATTASDRSIRLWDGSERKLVASGR